MNLLEQQTANRRRTVAVMVVFVVFLALVGAGVDLFIVGDGQMVATLAAVALGSGSAWGTLRFGDRAVLASASAVPLADRIASAGKVSEASP